MRQVGDFEGQSEAVEDLENMGLVRTRADNAGPELVGLAELEPEAVRRLTKGLIRDPVLEKSEYALLLTRQTRSLSPGEVEQDFSVVLPTFLGVPLPRAPGEPQSGSSRLRRRSTGRVNHA